MCAIVFESLNQMYALVFHIVGIKLYNLKNMTPNEYQKIGLIPIVDFGLFFRKKKKMCHGEATVFAHVGCTR